MTLCLDTPSLPLQRRDRAPASCTYIYNTCITEIGISQEMLSKCQCIFMCKASTATHLFPCERGVRQGCILSPLLFNLFTADLERELRKNKSGVELCSGVPLDMLMYADDVVLISSSAAGLRKHLHTLSEFCQK